MHLLRKHWLEAVWALFAAANVALMFFLANWETIPFHNVWVSLALLYCVVHWSVRVMTAILLCVILAVSAALTYAVTGAGDAGYDELAEVPMMTAMYLVIVFFAWRHQQALERLQRSTAREREFIRDVSHYLRTPITVALGHAELIRAGSEDEQLGEDAGIVVEELERVATISDRLLMLATPEDHLLLALEDVDPGCLAHATVRRWSPTASRRWQVDVSTEGAIRADAERLTLALDCLVENAVRATADGDTISIRSRSEAGCAVLEVADTGEGISAEDRERIFERFERAQRNGHSRAGAGLGLALAKAIVEAHGGALEVESAIREGSTFRIRLGPLQLSDLPVTAADYFVDGSRNSATERGVTVSPRSRA